MADWATIAAVLTSLGVGGLLGSVAKGRQETSEKLRDRTIESCTEWLTAHDAVRRELASAQNYLLASTRTHELSPEARALEGTTAAVDAALTKSLTMWRELQTQTFRVSLLLAGGTDAPAAQAAQALMVCYDRWRDVLVDLRGGTVEPGAVRKIIYFYVEHARVSYNEFVVEVNEAIRPWAPWRRGRRGDSNALDAIDDLDLFARTIRGESTQT